MRRDSFATLPSREHLETQHKESSVTATFARLLLATAITFAVVAAIVLPLVAHA